MTLGDMEPRVAVHYGIPSTASILAYDSIQRLLPVGMLDGRTKVIGGDNIEGLLLSSAPSPLKYLEFLQNQGFLVSVANENEIKVWDLQNRHLASNLQWESNISAFCVIDGTHYIYVGDEYGFCLSLTMKLRSADSCTFLIRSLQILLWKLSRRTEEQQSGAERTLPQWHRNLQKPWKVVAAMEGHRNLQKPWKVAAAMKGIGGRWP